MEIIQKIDQSRLRAIKLKLASMKSSIVPIKLNSQKERKRIGSFYWRSVRIYDLQHRDSSAAHKLIFKGNCERFSLRFPMQLDLELDAREVQRRNNLQLIFIFSASRLLSSLDERSTDKRNEINILKIHSNRSQSAWLRLAVIMQMTNLFGSCIKIR